MHQLVKRLNPACQRDITWDYRRVDEIIPAEAHQVTERFNDSGFHELLAPLQASVSEDGTTGIEYVLLADAKSSKTTVVAHFNPFANGLDNNMLIRAAYLHQIFEACSVTDQDNRRVPMLSFAAPNASRNIKLKSHHHHATAQGEFRALAREYANIISKMGYKSLLIIGFSQGATLAAAVAAVASEFGMVVSHLAVGEPANIMKRNRARLARDFNASAKQLNPAIEASGITHLQTFASSTRSSIGYVLGLARKRRLNMNLASGLSKRTFPHDLEIVLRHETVVTIGWGGLNTIAPPAVMKKLVADSRAKHDLPYHAIHTVELAGAHHTWADQLNALATFYAYSLLR